MKSKFEFSKDKLSVVENTFLSKRACLFFHSSKGGVWNFFKATQVGFSAT